MAASYKNSYKVYSAWNYQKEVEDLNKASAQGWQLVKGGCFHSRFVKNPDVQFRYQLDFGKIEDMGRYIETFREQGWEYINSTFNGWHYFRKVYDPSLPEEEYEIFSDRESLQEMNGRWAKTALIIGGIIALFMVISAIRLFRQPNLPRLVQFLTFLVEAVVLIRGGILMSNPDESRSRRGDSILLATFFICIILGAVLIIKLDDMRPNMRTEQQASSLDQPIVDNRWNDFEIRYKDNYYLNLEIEAEHPLTFAIVDENGNAVYEVTETSFKEENIRLKLPKGKYQLSMSCDSGFRLYCAIE